MNRKQLLGGLLFLLVACGQPPAAPPSSNEGGSSARPLGSMSLGIFIGSERDRETPVPASESGSQGLGGVRAQGFPATNDVTLSQATYTMRVLQGGQASWTTERWTFTAAFRVTNNTNQDLRNLTLVGRARAGSGIGGTALSRIQGQNGSLTTDSDLARQFEGINTITSSGAVIASAADLQAFRLEEIGQLQTQARTAGALTASDTVLNYGFVARKSNTSRTIPGTSCKTSPTDLCNTGTVSITFNTPAFPYTGPGSIPSLPLRLTFEALVVSDGVNRVTRSEEPTASAVSRAQGFGASEVALLGDDTDTAAPLTSVRVPGIKTYSNSQEDAVLNLIAQQPAFVALGMAINRYSVVVGSDQQRSVAWFGNTTNDHLFLALIESGTVKWLLRFKPVGAGFESLNVLTGRSFELESLQAILDADGNILQNGPGFRFAANFANIFLANPEFFEFPGIKPDANGAASGVVRPMDVQPPQLLIDLTCAPCNQKAAVLVGSAYSLVQGLISGGRLAQAGATKFFKELVDTRNVQKALKALKDAVLSKRGDLGGVALSVFLDASGIEGAGNDYYACLRQNCPPNLVIGQPPTDTLLLVTRPGTRANFVVAIAAASASGFTYTRTAQTGSIAEIPFPPPTTRYLPILPDVPGVLYGQQRRTLLYSIQCPASPTTLTDRITFTWLGAPKIINVTVRCTGGLLEPLTPGSVDVGVGSSFEGLKTLRNLGDAPLTYTASTVAGGAFSIVGGATGTIPAGGTASLTLRFVCGSNSPATQSFTLLVESDGGNTSAAVTLNCVSITVTTPVLSFNGPIDGCARVQALVTISDNRWVNAGFNVRISGATSTLTNIQQTGPRTFAFNLTRACNLAQGSYTVDIRLVDAGRGVTTGFVSAPFTVVDNRWPGVAVNDTNRCDASNGITLASVVSTATGEARQEALNILPGRAAAFAQRRNVTYDYRGVAANVLDFAEIVSGNFGGGGTIEGNPSVIDGKTAYWGVFFVRGGCSVGPRGAPMTTLSNSGSDLRAYYEDLVK
jgi:hypothetical protein